MHDNQLESHTRESRVTSAGFEVSTLLIDTVSLIKLTFSTIGTKIPR